ncbi:bifunctional ornithine acetyltransferase/N-acetylglutamate synthase [Synoicihabitans lomoniglobus]|uniref:Arginine biosynthesis bifunctional protein ArgJ n=1 Tax=Synoicihabitans lomoniglobus TaxID=2909285 RepID=A0AAE9ZVI7_9BACT|nr:bifunctional ornithine acetyltransferase/N-acetylglutamate synthase [Opitutaceae bacterium LMO-M01]WED63909.1 bifunctional ornithine acetyltransferase/N-acetylglutamate synthase [Opitutaceae bacterium LMO-M01]
MPSTQLTFNDREQHRSWLSNQATLPRGFRVGTHRFAFTPIEAPKPAKMTLTLIALDAPTPDFAAVFTRNAFPGAPIVVGRQRLDEPTLGAIVINNKISNVCAPGGTATAERVCAAAATALNLRSAQILPSSTGVIGWSLPADAMIAALPDAAAALQADSILPAAEGIVTTDLYPKIRSRALGAGRLVGIAKGAGMIEPNLATMLVYILTDIAVPRAELRAMLKRAVDESFNRISIDSDTSTSDTVALVSSGKITDVAPAEFESALHQICRDLAEDVVRNGEGVRHVIRVATTGAPDARLATQIGKAVVNAPLFKCAVAGNDPNVGRLVQAIGRYLGNLPSPIDTSAMRLTIGGIEIFAEGVFKLDPTKEIALTQHLQQAELYVSQPTAEGAFVPPIDFPPHERCVEIGIELGLGNDAAVVIGGDLTHEYVTENADYRS